MGARQLLILGADDVDAGELEAFGGVQGQEVHAAAVRLIAIPFREHGAFEEERELFGERTAPFVAICYGGTVLLLVIAGWLTGLGDWYYPALALPALLFARQIARLDIHDPGLCLRLFKSNREAGLAVAGAIMIGWV